MQQSAPATFRINMAPVNLDHDMIAEYTPYHICYHLEGKNLGTCSPFEAVLQGHKQIDISAEEAHMLSGICRDSEKKGANIMAKMTRQYLDAQGVTFSWDGVGLVWMPKPLECDPEPFQFELTGFTKDKEKAHLSMALTLERSKDRIQSLNRSMLEVRLTHIIKHVFSEAVNKMGGKTDTRTNVTYPFIGTPFEPGQGEPEKELHDRLRDIMERIEGDGRNSQAAHKLGPLKVVRGFDLNVALCGSFDDGQEGAFDAVQSGALVPNLVVTARTGVVMPEDMPLDIFCEKVSRSGLCRDDHSISEIIAKRLVKRNYGEGKIKDIAEIIVDGGGLCKDPVTRQPQAPLHGLPLSRTMMTQKGREISVQEFTEEKYNIRCKGNLPPVAVKGRGGEPSYLPRDQVNLLSDFFPSFGNAIQGCTTNLARTTPDQYKKLFKALMSYLLNESSEAGRSLIPWGIRAHGDGSSESVARIQGIQLCDPCVLYRDRQTVHGAGSWNMRGKQFVSTAEGQQPIALMSFGTQNNTDQAIPKFINEMSQIHRTLGMSTLIEECPPPRAIVDLLRKRGLQLGDMAEHFTDFRKYCQSKQIKTMYVVLNEIEPIGDVLYKFIKVAVEGCGIQTQCVKPKKTPVLNGKPPSPNHFVNIAAGLNTKMGYTNHTIQPGDAGGLDNIFGPNTAYCGVDLEHGKGGIRPDMRRLFGGDAPRISMASVVMTIDDTCTKTKARCLVQAFDPSSKRGLDIVDPKNCYAMMKDLVKERMNAAPATDHFVVVRDGVDQGSYETVVDTEIDALKRVLKDQKINAEVSLVCCMKKHGLRLFPDSDAQAEITSGSIAGVTVGGEMSHQRNSFPTFLSMGHHAIPGSTAVPLRVAVVLNPKDVPIPKWAQFIFASSHLDQVVQKTVSTPHISLYAHKSCDRGSFALDCWTMPGGEISRAEQVLGFSREGEPPCANSLLMEHFHGISNSAFL